MTTFTGTNGDDIANATIPSLTGFDMTAAELQDASDDTFLGLDGIDLIVAGSTNDTLAGDAGNDELFGQAGNDTITGGLGNDTIDGGLGNDTMDGGAGSDIFSAGIGHDTINNFGARYFTATLDGSQEVPANGSAATGSALLILNRAQTLLTLNIFTTGLDWDGAQSGGNVNDDVNGFHIHDAPAGQESGVVWDILADAQTIVNAAGQTVTSSWSAAEDLTANIAALLTDGLYLNIHTVAFGGGEIRGQIDEVAGGSADKIDLREFNIGSLATFQAITSDVSGSARMTTFDNGVSSTLTITGVKEALFTAAHFIFAGGAAQTINGTSSADYRFGAGGNDKINGLGGNDKLFGEAGNDTMKGGSGNDTLIGAAGRDTMYGDAGRDVFDFNAASETKRGSSRDRIENFKRGQDDIDLKDIDAKKGSGNQKFKFIGEDEFSKTKGELRYDDRGSKVIVQGDTNGDGKADFEIFVDASTLSKGDFVL